VYTVAVAVPLDEPELSVTGEPLVTEQAGRYDPPVGDVNTQVSVTVPEYRVLELTVMVEVAEAPGAMEALGEVAVSANADVVTVTEAVPTLET
jgi:hypothetical protein